MVGIQLEVAAHNLVRLFAPGNRGYDCGHNRAADVLRNNITTFLPPERRLVVSTAPSCLVCRPCPKNPLGWRRDKGFELCDLRQVQRLDQIVRPLIGQVFETHGFTTETLTVGQFRQIRFPYTRLMQPIIRDPRMKKEFPFW